MNPENAIRVLIVEDDVLVSEMIQGVLSELGYIVAGLAANGHEALEQVRTLHPDVVLMDISMPEMDGIAAAQAIQDDCPTPVVVLTAYESPDLVAQASEAGVGAYLIKPPDVREVARAITVARARFQDMITLRQLNVELDAYAHTVAHDLKNPLTRVLGFAEFLEHVGETVSEAEQKKYLHEIAVSARQMNNIIDELLLLASVRQVEDVGSTVLEMDDIIAEAIDSLRDMLARTRGVITTPEHWPKVCGHATWVKEVWINYISNALKYGGRPNVGVPPHVELGYDREGQFASPYGHVRFWVRDNGPGLTKADRDRLFTPFTRLDRMRAQGHGLGLSIVQRIVEKLDGQVGVESEPGAGSTFFFTLPGVDVAE